MGEESDLLLLAIELLLVVVSVVVESPPWLVVLSRWLVGRSLAVLLVELSRAGLCLVLLSWGLKEVGTGLNRECGCIYLVLVRNGLRWVELVVSFSKGFVVFSQDIV